MEYRALRFKDCQEKLIDVYMRNGHNKSMIKSFADKETEKIYHQVFSRKLPQNIQRVALRKLIMIDNAGRLEDLKVPPANRLEALSGKRKGQYSIRINDQYRICFVFKESFFYKAKQQSTTSIGASAPHGRG